MDFTEIKRVCAGACVWVWVERIMGTLTPEEQIEVVNAHPRIGAPKQTLSAASLKEQGYSSGTATSATPSAEEEAVLRELAALNDAYEQRFGFKFVVFVNGRPRAALLPVLRERMQNPREQELRTGLQAMMDIARDRLRKSGVEAAKL